jgi:8-oxo-dGTP diphosphatase
MDAGNLTYTLCFLSRGSEVLMLHRKRPPNQGLWNGIGGRIETGETPRQSVMREIQEESGFAIEQVKFEGLVTWEGFEIPAGGLYLFSAQAPEGEPCGNDEGELQWKPREWVVTSREVVSNIHAFGPWVFRGENPREHHFIYRDGQIESYDQKSLPQNLQVDW